MTTTQSLFYGYWRISSASPGDAWKEGNAEVITGTEFQFTTTGNVIWKTSKKTDNFPLLSCTLFTIYKLSTPPFHKLKLATGKGHVVQCQIQTVDTSGAFVFSDGWCSYTCEKIFSNYGEYPVDVPFNFLPALDDDPFSDLVIEASNNKEFKVHKCILKYAAPQLDWLTKPPPLSGYSEDVLRTILHYLYGECLPKDVSERTLKRVKSAAKDLPGMEKLIWLCNYQNENMAVKRKIADALSDLGDCLSKMKDLFENSEEKYNYSKKNFGEFYANVKESFHEGVVAVLKILLICKVYTEARTYLSQEDDFEILQQILLKIPTFTTHLSEYTRNLIDTIKRMNDCPEYWTAFTTFLVPKVKNILGIVSKILLKIRQCSGVMASAFHDHYNEFYTNKRFSKILGLPNFNFDKPKISPGFVIAEEFKELIFHFERGRKRFNKTNVRTKAQLLTVTVEEFLSEISHFKGTYEGFAESVEKQIIKGKIYFKMKGIALKANDLLSHILARREGIVDLLLQLCDVFQKPSFFESLADLGFFDSSPRNSIKSEKRKMKKGKIPTYPAFESACKSPPVCHSQLSEVGRQILESRELDDMVFEVINSTELDDVIDFKQNDSAEPESYPSNLQAEEEEAAKEEGEGKAEGSRAAEEEGKVVTEEEVAAKEGGAIIAEEKVAAKEGAVVAEGKEAAKEEGAVVTEEEVAVEGKEAAKEEGKVVVERKGAGEEEGTAEDKSIPERVLVKAHRAIVGSRCNWFRQALASGMKEDINRKIEIQLTPRLFSLFLEFTYTGSFSSSEVNLDDFLKLLFLSDRYDYTHLKEVCEYNLKKHICEETIFLLFVVSERYNATKLKLCCEDFFSECPSVILDDQFALLPENLKHEANMCAKGYATKNTYMINMLCCKSLDVLKESLSVVRNHLTSVGIPPTNCEKTISVFRPKLQEALLQLKQKLNLDDDARSVMIGVYLDADCDVDRAVALYTLRNEMCLKKSVAV